jgi:glycosyltransferase involved in cell wall biosynthesis
LLSFVTTAYNTNHVFLEELATSIFQQDGGMHFEWLILDNGSTNEDTRRTLQELARHPCVRLERVEHNLGIIEGMRFCLERAHGRYILPLDSDDLIEPDCVHVLTRFIKDKGYPPLLYTDEDKLGAGRFGSPYFKPDWDPVLFLNSCYIAHLCAIDREKALQLGLYTDKSAEGCHDWDSFIRFMKAGQLPCHVPEVLYSWRMHENSTSGNIASKSYITDSHRATLQRALSHCNAPHLELVTSPLFSYDVDWRYRRKHVVPISCVSLVITSVRGGKQDAKTLRPLAVIDADSEGSMLRLAQAVSGSESELVHLCWNGVTPDDDEWSRDTAGLLELFPDAVMVGGTMHNGTNVLDGPRIFGFGNGYDCPDRGRPLTDPGYFATMFKMRSVSAVSSGHCVVRREFLLKVIPTLLAERVDIQMLGPWLGALAAKSGKRVVFSPFMRAKAIIVPENMASENARAHFLSRFWSQLPDTRFYSSRLGLTHETAYTPVFDEDRDRHLRNLQMHTLPYVDWLEHELQERAASYPIPENPSRITFITTVYEGTNMEFLEVLAKAVGNQTVKPAQWVIVAHGPITKRNMKYLVSSTAERWGATLIIDSQPLGIVGAMRRGLEVAQGEYIVPLDADDVPTSDAVQILTHSITKLNRPDLIYSDEDVLAGGVPTSPYLRSAFDSVLNLDSSYIWHLCAINRQRAIALGLYTDICATWCHDWDSVMRVANSNGRIEHVPEVLYHWRQHADSTTNNAQGDSRSLDSVRHILERHIAGTATPWRFHVADWPEWRGSRELYIARKPDSLPQFVWIGDVVTGEEGSCNENAILVILANGIIIKSDQVFLEVARLMELHPQVGVVGGLVEGKDGVVIDSCYLVESDGRLESPWLGQVSGHGGPYALRQKTQSVATSGQAMAFFRISALKQAGVWPLKTYMASELIQLCGRLAEKGWVAAFSPLVKACVGSNHPIKKHKEWFTSKSFHKNSALVRYGVRCNFRCG